MSDDALQILSDNMNRLISKAGGVYSSNEAAQKGSQGKVSRSTFDRLRNIHKVGATAVGVDKLDGVAKTFGVEVWQLFIPGLDAKSPPQLRNPGEPLAPAWPFSEWVDFDRIKALSRDDLIFLAGKIDGALQALEEKNKD